jgi:uncharacterized protein YfiM (DUF2279 family)
MKEIIIALLICMSTMGQTVPYDKFMHFSSCYVISATSTNFLSHKYTKNEAAWIGFGIGATVGISKEIYDMKYGHSDENDLYADLLGAALGSIVIRISLNKRKKNQQYYYVRD